MHAQTLAAGLSYLRLVFSSPLAIDKQLTLLKVYALSIEAAVTATHFILLSILAFI